MSSPNENILTIRSINFTRALASSASQLPLVFHCLCQGLGFCVGSCGVGRASLLRITAPSSSAPEYRPPGGPPRLMEIINSDHAHRAGFLIPWAGLACCCYDEGVRSDAATTELPGLVTQHAIDAALARRALHTYLPLQEKCRPVAIGDNCGR